MCRPSVTTLTAEGERGCGERRGEGGGGGGGRKGEKVERGRGRYLLQSRVSAYHST